MRRTIPVMIVQARVGGTRLPRKVLEDVEGQPMICRVMERASRAKLPGRIIVAIPDTPENDELESLCIQQGWRYIRGPEEDVLGRYAKAVRSVRGKFQADPIVRITADCPLIDYGVIDGVIRMYLQGGYDYVSNNLEPTFPHGLDVECFSRQALLKADSVAEAKMDREHVTEFIRRNQDRPYRLGNLRFPVEQYPTKIAAILVAARLTVDYPEDLSLIRQIYLKYRDLPYISIAHVVDLLDKYPHLMAINEARAIEHSQNLSGRFEPMSVEEVDRMKSQARKIIEASRRVI